MAQFRASVVPKIPLSRINENENFGYDIPLLDIVFKS